MCWRWSGQISALEGVTCLVTGCSGMEGVQPGAARTLRVCTGTCEMIPDFLFELALEDPWWPMDKNLNFRTGQTCSYLIPGIA